jgi:pyocin large subunit-like protein
MMPMPTWAIRSRLHDHFRRHGAEFPYRTVVEYEASALDTVATGERFTYSDPSSGDLRIGFYDKARNHFTSVTANGRRITTHFRPRDGEQYVLTLPNSTYT